MPSPRRHWFRVEDEIERLPLDNDTLACLVRLLAHLNTRRSRDMLGADAACRAVLRPQVAMAIAGAGTLARARRILARLADHLASSGHRRPVDPASTADTRGIDGSLIVDRQGVHTLIEWRNLAEMQGWAARAMPPPAPAPDSGSDSGSVSDSQDHRLSCAPAARTTECAREQEGEREPEELADLRDFAAAHHPGMSDEEVARIYARTIAMAERKVIPPIKWPDLLRRELAREAAQRMEARR